MVKNYEVNNTDCILPLLIGASNSDLFQWLWQKE